MFRQWTRKIFVKPSSDWKGSERTLLAWAVLTGLATGLLAVLLKRVVGGLHNGISGLVDWTHCKGWLGIGPILGLLATGWVVRKFLNGEHPGPGVPSILQALSNRQGRIKRTWMFAPLITSSLSVGLGGSGGLEGPSLQSAAAIGSEIGRQTKRSFNRRMLLIGCAASASLAALFKAPIAAIIFAVEVIMIDLTAASLVPLLLASLSALITATVLMGDENILSTPELGTFKMIELPLYALLGLFCGGFSVLFSRLYRASNGIISWLPSRKLRVIFGGGIIGTALLLYPSLYGEGYEVVNALFEGNSEIFERDFSSLHSSAEPLKMLGLLMLIWLLKPVLTGVTTGAGGVAGVFAPAIFCGALMGYQFALISGWISPHWSLPIGGAVLAGLAGLVSGVLHAPLTAILLAAEVSGGYSLFVPVMLTAGIGFQFSKWWMRNSVYTKELAERGELLTHDKDQAILTLMKLEDLVETDFERLDPHWKLGQLISIIESSPNVVFPVLDREDNFMGVVQLQDIREVMFDHSLYETMRIHELMVRPNATIQSDGKMDEVMDIFDHHEGAVIPVLHGEKYAGFVSRSNLLNAYREWLKNASPR